MAEIQAYKRRKNLIITCNISDNGDIGAGLVHRMYENYCRECSEKGVTPVEFHPDHAFQFNNRLAFGFYDGGLGRVSLEFYLPEEYEASPKRDEMMQAIVGMLRDAGVQDEEALANLGTFIADPAKKSMTTRSGPARSA